MHNDICIKHLEERIKNLPFSMHVDIQVWNKEVRKTCEAQIELYKVGKGRLSLNQNKYAL